MNRRGPVRYHFNCFLLILPALIINVVWASRLPPMWQFVAFWRDIPAGLAAVESVSRAVVNLLPVLMVLQIASRRQRIGLAAYLIGEAAYLLAWILMVYYPGSGWSLSLLGATAPAWTTLPWLVGIGLIGERLFLRVPYSPWIYLFFSVLFAASHTAHAALVYGRAP